MKSRTIAIGHSFGVYTLGAFAAALFVIALQMAVDGVCCCLQSERGE